MKTSQSFPFYPSDFLLGTMLMSAEEVGAYIRLLCFQWEQGCVPLDEAKLSKIAGAPFKRLADVIAKFQVSDDGYRNARLEKVRSEREAYQKRQSEIGKKGGRPKAKPSDDEKGLESQPFSETKAKEKLPSPSPSPNTPLPPDPPASPSLDGFELSDGKPEQGKEWGPNEQQKLVARCVNRRDSTAWSPRERKAWNAVKPQPSDIEIVGRYYAAELPKNEDFRRHDLLTLLNNWPGEIDRANRFLERQESQEDFRL